MNTKIVRNIINIDMPIMMITLMAYQLIGKAYHEYAGTALFIIFIIHNILNIKWYSKLFKGNYTPYRILSTIINILLLITMILLMISGIIMSEYTFSFLNINSGMAISRLIHLSASHLGFILVSIHMGMHLGIFLPKNTRPIIKLIFILIAIYGAYSLYSRKILSYVFLTNKFMLTDFNENIFKFVIDYTSIMILFTIIGYIISLLIKKHIKKFSN